MKLYRSCILLIGLVVLLLSSLLVSAETQTDASGDVYHWKLTGTAWGWKPSTDPRPNIDITELTYTSDGNQVTISLKVAGTIQSSENIAYWAWVNTSDAFYQLFWMNGQDGNMAMSTENAMQFELANATIIGDTITCTFNLVGNDYNSTEYWGYAAEYEVFGDVTNEWWGDWIPGDYSPFWGQDDDDDGNGGGDDTGNGDDGGSPGFETIAIIAAVAVVFILLKRRK